MSETDRTDVSVVTLTSDFGTGSPYAAAMKGVILSINPRATLVDISHDVRPQDVRHGAITLEDVSSLFPAGTIHVVVVDPGVGTDRAILYAEIGTQRYIAPDNGLLSRLAARTRPTRVIQLTNEEFWLHPVSRTFHGRDIMAPVAARLSLGLDPNELGPGVEILDEVEWPEPVVKPHRIDGVILQIDSFGNLVSNIPSELLANRPTDERACVVCGIYETQGIFGAYAEHHQGSFIALVGSTGCLELALVGDNAANRLGLSVGTPITVAWE